MTPSTPRSQLAIEEQRLGTESPDHCGACNRFAISGQDRTRDDRLETLDLSRTRSVGVALVASIIVLCLGLGSWTRRLDHGENHAASDAEEQWTPVDRHSDQRDDHCCVSCRQSMYYGNSLPSNVFAMPAIIPEQTCTPLWPISTCTADFAAEAHQIRAEPLDN